VGHPDPRLDKTPADKQAAMTGERFMFAAHARAGVLGAISSTCAMPSANKGLAAIRS
jgi:hypothetical protein